MPTSTPIIINPGLPLNTETAWRLALIADRTPGYESARRLALRQVAGLITPPDTNVTAARAAVDAAYLAATLSGQPWSGDHWLLTACKYLLAEAPGQPLAIPSSFADQSTPMKVQTVVGLAALGNPSDYAEPMVLPGRPVDAVLSDGTPVQRIEAQALASAEMATRYGRFHADPTRLSLALVRRYLTAAPPETAAAVLELNRSCAEVLAAIEAERAAASAAGGGRTAAPVIELTFSWLALACKHVLAAP